MALFSNGEITCKFEGYIEEEKTASSARYEGSCVLGRREPSLNGMSLSLLPNDEHAELHLKPFVTSHTELPNTAPFKLGIDFTLEVT